MSSEFKYDVFLSHNSKDKPQVRRLAERLKEAGVRVWLDEWVIRAGDIIALKVDEGLEQSRALLLCISPAALASGWVTLERSTAVHRDPANAGRRFIPLLLGDCALPDTLRRYKYLDYREESEAAFGEVLTICRPESESTPEAQQPKGQKVPAKSSATRPVAKESKPAKPPTETEPMAVLKRKLTGHRAYVNSVAVSSDGKWAASGSGDRRSRFSRDATVRIWDLVTGECRATLEGHESQVNSVAITPDGKRILSCADDNSIRLWDAQSGRQLLKMEGHIGSVHSVVALQDNNRALTGGE